MTQLEYYTTHQSIMAQTINDFAYALALNGRQDLVNSILKKYEKQINDLEQKVMDDVSMYEHSLS